MFLSIVMLIFGFFLLVKGADYFVDSCSKVAKALGVSSLIIGLTIVSFGTSAPEAAVSVVASLTGNNDISIGNVVGSNICNLLLVLGVSGMFGSLTVKRKIVYRDMIYSVFSYIVLTILTLGFFLEGKNTGVLTRTNGLILLCFLAIYLYALLVDAKRSNVEKEERPKIKLSDFAYIIGGILGIVIGGELVVNSATSIAEWIGVSDNVIALTVVAIGTSLPELVTSVIATRKGETDIAIGNVIGSNIFNIFFILGLSSALSPITFGLETMIDILILLVVGLIVFILVLKNYRIGNKKGPLLLFLYILYMVYILIR